MSYSSDRINQDDVARYKRMLASISVKAMTRDQQLAFAQALEERAAEIRQQAMDVNEAAKNDIW